MAVTLYPGRFARASVTSSSRAPGQHLHPAIRFGNGTRYREGSSEMARLITEGRLMNKVGPLPHLALLPQPTLLPPGPSTAGTHQENVRDRPTLETRTPARA
jgi:hypothetical protein